MNVRRYLVVFRSTWVYLKMYAQFSRPLTSPTPGQPGSREGCPRFARCEKVDKAVVLTPIENKKNTLRLSQNQEFHVSKI